jgi:hypothetical protein
MKRSQAFGEFSWRGACSARTLCRGSVGTPPRAPPSSARNVNDAHTMVHLPPACRPCALLQIQLLVRSSFREIYMFTLFRFIFIGSTFSAARAVDCFAFANYGTSLHLCDRWIACRDSGGTLCDDGNGNLGTSLCVAAPRATQLRGGAPLGSPSRAPAPSAHPPSARIMRCSIHCGDHRAPRRRVMYKKGITGVIPPADLAKMTALTGLYVRAAPRRRPRASSPAAARTHLKSLRPHCAHRRPSPARPVHARAPTHGAGACSTTS